MYIVYTGFVALSLTVSVIDFSGLTVKNSLDILVQEWPSAPKTVKRLTDLHFFTLLRVFCHVMFACTDYTCPSLVFRCQ